MEAVLYLRVSTLDQVKDGVSLEAQEAKARAWCDLNGYAVLGIFIDAGISGSKRANRPELQDALSRCKKGVALVVYSLSRLSRSTRDTLDIADLLNRQGGDLVSLTEKIDTTTAAGKMVFRLLAVLNEFERDLVGDRTTEAMRHKKSKKQAYSRPVFGFDRIGNELAVNEEEQEVLGLIRRLRSKKLSYQAIAQELNSKGVPTKRGGRRWYDSTVRNILMNDIHTQVSNG